MTRQLSQRVLGSKLLVTVEFDAFLQYPHTCKALFEKSTERDLFFKSLLAPPS